MTPRRPVDLLIRPDGIIFISDDHAGVIYRVVYNRMVKK
jgi:glucose/arabinose dehydrogenase